MIEAVVTKLLVNINSIQLAGVGAFGALVKLYYDDEKKVVKFIIEGSIGAGISVIFADMVISVAGLPTNLAYGVGFLIGNLGVEGVSSIRKLIIRKVNKK